MNNQRNRSEGWKYAKITGHNNEKRIKELLLNDKNIQNYFLKSIQKPDCYIKDVISGGIVEKNIPSIFTKETTKSKTDIKVILSDDSIINISLKKSFSG